MAAGSLAQELIVEPDSLMGGCSLHSPIPGSEGKIINTTSSDIMIDSITVVSISNAVEQNRIQAYIYIEEMGRGYIYLYPPNYVMPAIGKMILANDTLELLNECWTGNNLDYQNTSGPDDPLIHSFWLETHIHYQDTFLTLYLRGADLDITAPIKANIVRAPIKKSLGTAKIYNLRGQMIGNKQSIADLSNQATGVLIQHNGNHSNKLHYKK